MVKHARRHFQNRMRDLSTRNSQSLPSREAFSFFGQHARLNFQIGWSPSSEVGSDSRFGFRARPGSIQKFGATSMFVLTPTMFGSRVSWSRSLADVLVRGGSRRFHPIPEPVSQPEDDSGVDQEQPSNSLAANGRGEPASSRDRLSLRRSSSISEALWSTSPLSTALFPLGASSPPRSRRSRQQGTRHDEATTSCLPQP